MHPPTRRRSRPPLLHQQPEIPPISAEPLAYPPETPVPYLAANISSGSTSPHLVMSRNKRTSPPTAKPHRLSTAPGNYAYPSPQALHSISARSALRASLVGTAPCRRLVSTLQPAAVARQHFSLSASPTPAWPSCAQGTATGGGQVLRSERDFQTTC